MKITTKTLTRSALVLALAIAVQSLRMPTYITGPLVNTLLFLATALIGPISAVLIGLLTPLLALAFGIMAFAPAVPVVMLGNAVLAIVFALLLKNKYLAVALAALTKYAAMYVGVTYLLPLLLNIPLPPKVAATLTTPQLFTALAGGVIALAVIKGTSVLHLQDEAGANEKK